MDEPDAANETPRTPVNQSRQRLIDALNEAGTHLKDANDAINKAWIEAEQIPGFDLLVEIGDGGALKIAVLEHVTDKRLPDLPPHAEGGMFGAVSVPLDSIIDTFLEIEGRAQEDMPRLRAFNEALRAAVARTDELLANSCPPS